MRLSVLQKHLKFIREEFDFENLGIENLKMIEWESWIVFGFRIFGLRVAKSQLQM